jgi:hypothetical protein
MILRLASVACIAAVLSQAQMAVVAPAGPLERLAASELASYLTRMYPDEKFSVTDHEPSAGQRIVFTRGFGNAEGFSVKASGDRLTIASGGPRGALFAAYALLEKLGCGFYLSYETVPPARTGQLVFDGLDFSDAPLFPDRIVFDWHNFLSSASSWEFQDWQRYIDHAVRMGFNNLMVHAYGNNPMVTFRFAGMTKPVGYLATTQAGRDWGTEHVNDVRRLIGGDLFSEPVFGASIAKLEESRRVDATRELMQRVFEHAAERGMGVTFALDVDTESANPQAMIATLPPSARITSGKFQLADPDTPEGYALYKAQVDQLLAAYPRITRLAVWFRNNATPWTAIRLEEFPATWKQEFKGDPVDAPMFAMGKLVRAFGRALKETGHGSVELAAGSWRLDFLKSADLYLPREATLIPLDWATIFDTAAGQRALRTVRSGRKLTPIVWAHHDDRTFIGRPYTPYVNFSTLLESVHASGFGIIHWTTRPLDLYFKGTIVQTWSATRNQPLEDTCAAMGGRGFGDYLFSWVTEAPMFGRETSDRFMDVLLADAAAHMKKSRQRSDMLARIPPSARTPQVDYFDKYEKFIYSFFAVQTALERAHAHLEAGEFEKARAELRHAQPEEVIRAYVDAARSGEITQGEKALVISLNLRWLPYFVSARQAAGLEPVRIRIGKVEQEPLAQGAGHNTFYFDEQGQLWRVFDRDTLAGKFRTGAIMGDRLEPGRYGVNNASPKETHAGQIEMDIPPNLTELVITRAR